MAVFRVIKNNDYTTMSNFHLRDKNLSLSAKGLQSFFLSLPEDWDYSINGLVGVLKEGKTAIKGSLEELKDNGYLIIEKVRNDKGQFEYLYNIYEQPQKEINQNKIEDSEVELSNIEELEAENPDIEKPALENQPPKTEKPDVENPSLENRLQINTNKQNTNNKNKKKKKEKENETEIDGVITKNIQDEDIKQAFYDFIKMRKAIKKPLTTKGVELVILRLNKLSKIKEEQILILNKSIMNNWQGIFGLNDEDRKMLKKPEEYKEITITEEEYIKRLNSGGKRYG